MSHRVDLLDRLARRFDVAPPTRSATIEASFVAEPQHRSEEEFSRGSALKLGALGVVSLSLGLWRTPTARGQGGMTRAQCLDGCHDGASALLNRLLTACADLYQPQSGYERGWQQLRTLFRAGFLSFYYDAYWATRAEVCYADVRGDVENWLSRCLKLCRTSCPPGQAPAPGCGKPPPKPRRPQVPPPPPIPPPSQKPADCGTLAPPGAKCCPIKGGGDVPCFLGCAKDGNGCCASADPANCG